MLARVRKCAKARATVRADDNRHLPQQPIEVFEIGVDGPRAFGCLAHLFDALEDLLALMMPQHPSQQLAKEPNVVPQRLMRIRAIRPSYQSQLAVSGFSRTD